ncbi:DUF742 domain-containing protein [Kineosporia sp. R_H_3]|uniref:DUF742 domain-containing protein n=1 Tax=Kineosporia sp. R_H_3 TaxID=1961848 RepID=UPI000B4A86AD|nr:DUF742 domain-containing protein [Kineosporia sp. R_H_3]
MSPFPRDRAGHRDGGADETVDAPSVRPYMVTGGRTRPSGDDLPIEALVECLVVPADPAAGPAVPGQNAGPGAETRSSATYSAPRLASPSAAATASLAGPESRRILELTAGCYLSVAEISAHAHLPVGVVRVLVADLAEAGAVRVHGLTPASLSDPADPRSGAAALAVLESVLNGISAL